VRQSNATASREGSADMRNKKVSDVMTTEVVSVNGQATFHRIAELLAEHRISALPVVKADGTLGGMISETDLLRKIQYTDGTDVSLFQRTVRHDAVRKAEARTARELMTKPVITVVPDASLVTAAKTMDAAGVKRLPVVDELGRLVGIVSRGDLLKVFLRTDEDIHTEVVKDVLRNLLWIDQTEVAVDVLDGVVRLEGQLEQKSLVSLAVELVHGVDGVVDVIDMLTFRVDDTTARDADYYRPLV